MESKSNTVRVWDPLVRIFHWSLVVSFAVAYLSSEKGEGQTQQTGGKQRIERQRRRPKLERRHGPNELVDEQRGLGLVQLLVEQLVLVGQSQHVSAQQPVLVEQVLQQATSGTSTASAQRRSGCRCCCCCGRCCRHWTEPFDVLIQPALSQFY